ncbi:hypothetical protein PR048_023485 [Dryococelus australis]|uniref:Mos1 transposase HTH domain-containing protein n=1 Tax=Dryococelus australis TaxID=614101 RepID=A0ABQ9GUE0_9NEOP|nr:hypothetical protein PR048_023485 [Dryococelus australis]
MEPVDIHRRIVSVYGEKVMSVQQARKRCRELVEGKTNVNDEEWSGLGSTSDTIVDGIDEMVQKVCTRWVPKITVRPTEAQHFGGHLTNQPSVCMPLSDAFRHAPPQMMRLGCITSMQRRKCEACSGNIPKKILN